VRWHPGPAIELLIPDEGRAADLIVIFVANRRDR
jgi:hypothetical protein